MLVYFVLLFQVLLLLSGQILWKTGLNKVGQISMANFSQILFSPYTIGGLLIYGVATLLWFWILSKAEFSVVYPLQSLSYVLGIFAAMLLFHEVIPTTRWVGVALIISGAILIARH